jgi:hypothetical protein
MRPIYPSSTDIGYAEWLKHFAIHLPLIANRYEISESEVFTVQALAHDFYGLLIHRTHCATQAIVLRQQLPKTSQRLDNAVGAGMCILLQEYILNLVQRIYKHSTYCEEDNVLLRLGRFPFYSNNNELVSSEGVWNRQTTTVKANGVTKRKRISAH